MKSNCYSLIYSSLTRTHRNDIYIYFYIYIYKIFAQATESSNFWSAAQQYFKIRVKSMQILIVCGNNTNPILLNPPLPLNRACNILVILNS